MPLSGYAYVYPCLWQLITRIYGPSRQEYFNSATYVKCMHVCADQVDFFCGKKNFRGHRSPSQARTRKGDLN